MRRHIRPRAGTPMLASRSAEDVAGCTCWNKVLMRASSAAVSRSGMFKARLCGIGRNSEHDIHLAALRRRRQPADDE